MGRSGTWALAAATLLWGTVRLAAVGVLALVVRLAFDQVIAPFVVALAVPAVGPVTGRYRAEPPHRRRGAAAGLLAYAAAGVAVQAAVERFAPVLVAYGADVPVALLLAGPVAAAVFSVVAGRPPHPAGPPENSSPQPG